MAVIEAELRPGAPPGPAPVDGERLRLRVFRLGEAVQLSALLIDFEVVRFAGEIPWPYGLPQAAGFIAQSHRHFAHGRDCVFAIERLADDELIGCIALHADAGGKTARLGYWLGQPYWRNGYATEAARRVVAFAFEDLKADMVWAGWFHDNPRSGNVLAKLGCVAKAFEKRPCLARGMEIGCNTVTLSREAFLGRRAA